MDFNNIDIGEDLSAVTQASKQATHDEIIARHTAALAKELHQQGGKLIQRPQAARVAVNPVSQMEYNSRKHALLNIIRNPELSAARYPLAESWRQISKEPYNDKATNWKISKHDATDIVALMKELGVYKRFKLAGAASIIAIVKDYYQSQQINILKERIKTLELMISDTGSIWYSGVEIQRHTRQFKVVVHGTVLTTRHGTFDKLLDFLRQIDEKL